MSSEHKDPSRVIGGLKAAVVNPNVSKEAKARDRDILEEMGVNPDERKRGGSRSRSRSKGRGEEEEEEGILRTNNPSVLQGYKASLKNPRTSNEAKDRAEEILKENEVL